jgi:hypothetical protein
LQSVVLPLKGELEGVFKKLSKKATAKTSSFQYFYYYRSRIRKAAANNLQPNPKNPKERHKTTQTTITEFKRIIKQPEDTYTNGGTMEKQEVGTSVFEFEACMTQPKQRIKHLDVNVE